MFRSGITNLVPNSRSTDQSLGTGRGGLRLSVEPITSCNVGPFLAYMKALFSAAYPKISDITENKGQVVEALRIAHRGGLLAQNPVEFVDAKLPRSGRGEAQDILLIEIRFRAGKARPVGAPISGTYQGSIEQFIRKLFR